MSTEERTPFVARPADVEALRTHWIAARDGGPRIVRLVSPFGGGRRALAGELMRELQASSDDVILWRVACSDQETGVQWLMRLYGGLVGFIANDVLLRGKVEMILNGQLPRETKRVQDWFQGFVQTLREAKPDAQSGQIQLRIAQDNPLVGLVEVLRAITSKIPVVLDLQNAHQAHTVLVAQFLEAVAAEAGPDGKLLILLHDEPDGPVRDASHPAPLLDLIARRDDLVHALAIAPWGADEAQAYLDSRDLTGNAAGLATLTGGRPGFLAEVVDLLAESDRLGDDLSGVTLADLVPMGVDEDDLETPESTEGGRKHATAADAPQIAYFAALLGQAFPSALVAEMGGYDKGSIDDLLDAMGDLFEEVQFNEQMQTWIYRFARGTFREGVLVANDTDEGHELARRVAVFMERFLAPRGIGFVTRTCRLYAEHGAPGRAQSMRAMALTSDDPNAWGVAYEILRYFDEVPWQDTLRRTIFTTLLDHLAQSGQLQAAEQVHTTVTTWATEHDDRDLQAWLLLNGSKLDLRRQDLFRARDRARDAIKMFEALEQPQRAAEAYAHLAGVALADGKSDEANEAADKALQHATVTQGEQQVVQPAIAAQVALVKGVIDRRANKLDDAVAKFKQANEIAGNAGLGPLALDAGMNLGEALVASNKAEEARQVLRRVLAACQQLGQTLRERGTAELLARAEAQAGDLPRALGAAKRVLQITEQQKLNHLMPVDLYWVGFFHLAQNAGATALPFFERATQALQGQDNHPIARDLWYHHALALLQKQDVDGAKPLLEKALPLLEKAGDHRKTLTAYDQLAGIAHRAGDAATTGSLLDKAIALADATGMKDEKRALAKKREQVAAG